MRKLNLSLLRSAAALVLAGTAALAQAGLRIDHWQAPSGAQVYFVETHVLPILDVQVDFAAGGAYAPADKAGVAGLTHGLLDLGAGAYSEDALADRLADLGAQLGGSVDQDRASLTLRTLSAADKQEGALAVLQAVLQQPHFGAAEFGREKARAILGLKEALTKPDVLASRAFWQTLYPHHPYGIQVTPESLEKVSREDVQAFWRDHYSASRATVTLVGDLTRAQAEAIAQRLTAQLPAGTPLTPLPPVTAPAAAQVALPHPAAQAHLYLGLPAIAKGDPDYFPLLVGNYTLGGGGFMSRLMHEVRDERGLAYSVYSYFMPMRAAGPFQIGLQTKRDQAGQALQVVDKVLKDFLAQGPTAAELQAAKANLAGSFPLRLDNNRKILENVAVIGFYGLPLDYLDTYVAQVNRVSAADIRAAFARHVTLDHLVTVKVAAD